MISEIRTFFLFLISSIILPMNYNNVSDPMIQQTWVFDLTNLWDMDEIFFRVEKLAHEIDQRTYEYLTSFIEKSWANRYRVVQKIWETYICKTWEWLEIQIIKNYKWSGYPVMRISKDTGQLTRMDKIEETLKTNSSIPMREWVDPIDMIQRYMLALYSLWERKFLEKHRAPIASWVNNILYNKASQEWELQKFDFQSLANEKKDKSMEIFHGIEDWIEHRVQIDEREFIFTNIIEEMEWRKYILGATRVNGIYESRLFYFSQSGGNWHCTPWIKENGYISKALFLWVSYEKWTVVNSKLSTLFDSLNFIYPDSGYYNIWWYWTEKLGIMDESQEWEFQRRYGHEFNITKLYSDSMLFHMDYLPSNITKEELIDTFRNFRLPDTFDQSFPDGFRKGYTYNHDHLWEVDTIIGKTYFDGKWVDVVFAFEKSNPSLVWVENIYFTHTKINSFGIPNESINAGILTAKPIDYTHQIPKSIIYDSKRYSIPGVTDYSYTDIREYMQQNPLIVKFKELYRNESNDYISTKNILTQPPSAIPTL